MTKKPVLIIAVLSFFLMLSESTIAIYNHSKIEYYKTHFFPNTYINDIDCSNMTLEEAEDVYLDNYYNYNTTIHIGNSKYKVTKNTFVFSNVETLDSYLAAQNPRLWRQAKENKTEITTSCGDTFEKTIDFIMNDWSIFDKSTWTESSNAYFVFNEDTDSFEIVPEVLGTKLNLELARDMISKQLSGIDVENTNDVYEYPEITASNSELNNIVYELNNIINKNISYSYRDKSYVIDSEYIRNYLEVDYDNWKYSFNPTALSNDFVKMLSSELNTSKNGNKFRTYEGNEITIYGGNWYNEINEQKMKEELVKMLTDYSIPNVEGTLHWKQLHDPDLNKNNYVEVDLGNQKVYLFKDGELLGDSSIVTGNVATNHTTPEGVFTFQYKVRNATLTGPGYSSFVNFWMPFNGGIGLHDASWRQSFGGEIYKTNGSHGCINMPYYMAELIYNNIDSTYAIICHN